jgi:hypothetical protein
MVIGGFPSYEWSDLLVTSRGVPLENLKISQCPHCSHFFWVQPEHTLGILENNSPLEWQEAPQAKEIFDFETWKHILDIQLFDNEEQEYYVRLHTWQTYNHFFRYNIHDKPDDASIAFNQQNISRLYQIIPSKSEENWLLKAEIQRHLGNWEECIQICRKTEKKLQNGHYLRVAFRKMRKLAQEQHSKVFPIFS